MYFYESQHHGSQPDSLEVFLFSFSRRYFYSKNFLLHDFVLFFIVRYFVSGGKYQFSKADYGYLQYYNVILGTF